ncbi:helix-turn-helix domain-containing protein [Anaerocolumna sp. MB42-C2]|uniref:helix-turn-helix domain-containing protein n=1 Tax=Anaerocolumna sp. MB42-C2 TaxID=3070997 RepID=UPI0027E0CC23|nr:AraC family transcriptional regulator [Anaerocolumna sp. MB42-C2]WMJ87014.1 AraC family transcriptional regulator [Anaerocolumna sp. MB42-C2]
MNNLHDIFFHIHYCNGSKLKKPGEFNPKIARSLPHEELIYVCNGTGSFKIKNRKYSVRKGMLLYINHDVPYSIEMDTAVPAGFLTVHFSYAKVRFNNGKWDIKDQIPLPAWPSAQELKETYLIEEHFQKLVNCWNEKLPGYEFTARTMLQQLLILIIQNLNKKPQNYAMILKVEKMIQYMNQNINCKITIPELSKLVQMTPAYMSRAFKEITGYSIIEYFNRLKIDKSKELLIEGNKKVKEVSQLLGFADEFYFSRMFKKLEGITPSEFSSRIIHES